MGNSQSLTNIISQSKPTMVIGKLHFILGALSVSQLLDQTIAVTFICRDADTLIKESQELSLSFRALTTLYELNKTGTTQEEPIDLNAVYDYTSVNNGRNFDKVKEICEVDFGYDLCTVTTRSKHSETLENFPILRDVQEISKPACFPKSCSNDQANLVYPNPSNCDPTSGNCEILSYETTCPTRNVTVNTTTCEVDLIPSWNPFYGRVGLLDAAVLTSCATLIAGGQSETCSLEYGSFAADNKVNMPGEILKCFPIMKQTVPQLAGKFVILIYLLVT